MQSSDNSTIWNVWPKTTLTFNSQVLAFELLKMWDYSKLQQHYRNVREFYKERRDIMLEAANKHLKGNTFGF